MSESHDNSSNSTPRTQASRPTPLPVRHAAIADAISLGIGFTASFAIRFLQPTGTREVLPFFTVISLAIIWLWVASLAFNGAYRWSTVANGITDTSVVIRASLYAFLITGALSYVLKLEVSRIFVFVAFPLGTLLLVLGRRVLRAYLFRIQHSANIATPVLLVSRAGYPSGISELMTASTEISFDKIFAFEVTDEIIHRNDFINNVIQKLDATHVNRLILDQGLNLSNQQISELSWELDQRSVEMLVVPEFLGIWASRLQLVRHASLPLIELLEPRLSPVQQTQKRVLDLVITIPVFILLQPLYLFITLLVAMSSPGPVLFIQERVGTDGKAFKFYKFRTMRNGAELERQEILGLPDDEITERYKHDPRVTSVGRILRRFSIDELPQLWNVIRGDMSLVGPRPMLFDEIALLDENQQRRHLTKPGLTGLWQISGRKETSWEERILLDLYYIDQWSISSDLAIMLKTLKVVADGKGSY